LILVVRGGQIMAAALFIPVALLQSLAERKYVSGEYGIRWNR
jgi:hypothetical protein